jgi:predicted dienelactone hydrolase
MYTSRLFGVPLGAKWAPLSWTIGSNRSFENLPIDQGHHPFPVIVFSHGHQSNVIDYVYTLEDLASAGFIVVAPDHVNDTRTTSSLISSIRRLVPS